MDLLCSVRNCREVLIRELRRLVCARGHSFDVARSGYINLLQPQERRAKNPGDTKEAVAARRRIHDLGVTEPLKTAIRDFTDLAASDVVLDVGCGDGYYLGSLQKEIGFDGHGVDIAVPAIDLAARRYPACEWVVANADRVLPYSDGAFSVALSITGRMNSKELRRVLRRGGKLLVAIPSPDDLIELRGNGKDRTERTVEEFGKEFTLIGQRRADARAELDAAAVQDILVSIYRPMQPRAAVAGTVTFSLDLLLFKTTN
jgi:23S rRNA (guanine745-N1)-methyltransferase